MPIALSNLDASSWVCFVLGAAVLLVGVVHGLVIAPDKADEDKKKLAEAKLANETAVAQFKSLQAETPADKEAVATALAEKKTAAEQISTLVASLPEYQRFSGMLVLLGAALIGVATIQFGGTSIF